VGWNEDTADGCFASLAENPGLGADAVPYGRGRTKFERVALVPQYE
jgi:hypothetical protein